MADSSVYDVVKDQLSGNYDDETEFEEHKFYESRYGDFESLVNKRRQLDVLSYLPRVRADHDWPVD